MDQAAQAAIVRAAGVRRVHVTLEELRIELLYPADDVAEAFFRRCVRGSR
jgi:hypothetical protein